MIDAIARHNEVIVAPKFYFAGFTAIDYDISGVTSPAWLRPAGVTVQSFDCAKLDVVKICPFGALACGGSGELNAMNERVGTVTLHPRECHNIEEQIVWSPIQDANIAGGNAKDPIRVLLHELGHVVGLQHANQTDAMCSGLMGGVPGPIPGPTEGVMRTGGSAFNQRLRHWRRDDIEGMRALYDPHSNDLQSSPVWWSDDSFPAVPSAGSGVELDPGPVQVAPVSTSSGWEGAQVFLAAWVDSALRVRRALVDESGAVVSVGSVVDPTAAGISWHTPAVALGHRDGDSYELVAWTSQESTSGTAVIPRWAIRDVSGGSWEYHDGAEQVSARLHVGFDDVSEMFLFAQFSNASTVRLTTVSIEGEVVDQADGQDEVLDIGSPVCVEGVCVVPVSSVDGVNPLVGRIEVSTEGGLSMAAPTFIPGVDAFGRVGFALDGPDALRAVAGQRRFRVDLQDPLADPTPAPVPAFLDGDWPLSLGAFALEGGSTRSSILSAMPIRCGNGIVQGGEGCDDGNATPGDGCDAQCTLEGDETGGTTEGDGTGGTTGGLGELGEGCNCSLAGDDDLDPSLGWLLLPLLGVGAGRRRHRAAQVRRRG